MTAISTGLSSELTATVQALASRAESLERGRDESRPNPAQIEARLGDAAASVVLGTQGLFPGEVTVEAVDDPEIPGVRYLTVCCQSNRSVDEIVAGYHQWHRALPIWAPGLEHLFRLSVDAIE